MVEPFLVRNLTKLNYYWMLSTYIFYLYLFNSQAGLLSFNPLVRTHAKMANKITGHTNSVIRRN